MRNIYSLGFTILVSLIFSCVVIPANYLDHNHYHLSSIQKHISTCEFCSVEYNNCVECAEAQEIIAHAYQH